jgi:large subunit ribosomal protein L18
MKTIGRTRRHKRITKKMKGSAAKPRLVAFRSQKHMYAQLINDQEQKVLTVCTTVSKDFKGLKLKSTNKDAAKEIGKSIAKKALDLGIKEICFDRAGYKYHGRIKALADGVREGGLKF